MVTKLNPRPAYPASEWQGQNRVGSTLRLQAGVDNLLGYKDPSFIPNLAGRLGWVSVGLTLDKKPARPL